MKQMAIGCGEKKRDSVPSGEGRLPQRKGISLTLLGSGGRGYAPYDAKVGRKVCL